ncbi:flavin monoamine oxidase family protein [Halalkalibacter alkaliphilus]|uniref:FAD-dependent oxidoreductase n=1 Tax=Halalkalibacter alkaliphilus TaxID=2917993 RepID=A0A9X2CU56_9BACI|nr:FAD-dependent oxidoreductase [Halalkalibacter alkaliphilus]MCL7748276.1 FAD-dependent oxidoreductase [Halalkalibacter alkaliphilus]
MKGLNEVNVVIVGAGLAGLTAAHELKKRDVSFIILEARSRAGGRVYSTMSDENLPIDLGAQWIGPGQKRMMRLAEEYNLQLTPTFQKGKTLFHLRGKKNKTKGNMPKLSALATLNMMILKKKIDKLSKQIPANEPWTSELAKQLDKMTLEEFIQVHSHSNSASAYYRLIIEELLCAKLYEVSALDFLWCIKSAGSIDDLLAAESFWFKDGAGKLIDKLIEPLTEFIYFDHPVQRIIYEEKKAVVYARNQSWTTSEVIITIPPNFITNIHFDPPLPSDRVQLSERAGLPSVTKLIFIYDRPFWRELGLNGTAYSDQPPVNLTIDSSPEDGKRGILTVLIGSKSARDLASMKAEARHDLVKKALIRFFGKEAELPLRVFEKDWTADMWTHGGYGTHFPTGVISHFGPSLIEPVGPIHWAGTETAFEWRMYMEGAVQSGERVVSEVLNRLK